MEGRGGGSPQAVHLTRLQRWKLISEWSGRASVRRICARFGMFVRDL